MPVKGYLKMRIYFSGSMFRCTTNWDCNFFIRNINYHDKLISFAYQSHKRRCKPVLFFLFIIFLFFWQLLFEQQLGSMQSFPGNKSSIFHLFVDLFRLALTDKERIIKVKNWQKERKCVCVCERERERERERENLFF
jgi:hypothetical protein